MTKYIDFEKDPNNRWYAILPEWEGERWELEMVMGADDMLEILSQGESPISLILSTDEFEGYKYKLTYKNYFDGGAYYYLQGEFFEFVVWLCHVTEFVFGELPKELYVGI